MCRALEIELRVPERQTGADRAGESDELKLLALNAMMRQDEGARHGPDSGEF